MNIDSPESASPRCARRSTSGPWRRFGPPSASWIAWDDRLTGLRRPHPSRGHQDLHRQLPRRRRRPEGGQQARLALAASAPMTAEQARRQAHEILGKAAGGADPCGGTRTRPVDMPTLGDAFDDYMKPPIPTGRKRTERALPLRDHAAISATGSPGPSTASPAATSRRASTASPPITDGRRPIGRCRC